MQLPLPGRKGSVEEPGAGWGGGWEGGGGSFPRRAARPWKALSQGSQTLERTPLSSGCGGALTPLTVRLPFPPAVCSFFLLFCLRFRLGKGFDR